MQEEPAKEIKFEDTTQPTPQIDDKDRVIVVTQAVPQEQRTTFRQLEEQLKFQQEAVKATEAQLVEYRTALGVK